MNVETTEVGDEAFGLGDVPLERLEREITQLAAHINAATCSWLLLVGEFDRRRGWGAWGCNSCAHWLSYRCGLSPAAGREQVRVARALPELPAIRAAFGRGELCYSQVRALTRIASPETEADLVVVARHATAGELEVIVRAYRGLLPSTAPGSRYLHCRHDDDGSLLIQARLPADEGALVVAALEAGRDAIRAARRPDAGDPEQHADTDGAPRPAAGGGSVSAETTQSGDNRAEALAVGDGEPAAGGRPAASNADAIVLMAQTLLSTGAAERTGADDYQVVVHVDAATLADRDDDDQDGDGGPCQLDHGPALHPDTARRLACDASLVRILESDGRPLSIGRKTRTVPPALRRALKARDPVCRFPGCPQRRFLHAHHIHHWAHGGRTDLSNLIQLCSHHHRLLHEGGYTTQRAAHGKLRFLRPDGQPLPTTTANTTGQPGQIQHRNRQNGLHPTDRTCVPIIYPGDRLDLDWQIAGFAEVDSRITP